MSDASTDSAGHPKQVFDTSRIIYLAIVSGPLLLALVGWFATGGGSPLVTEERPLRTYLWGAGVLAGSTP